MADPVAPEYNASEPDGGNSRFVNVNDQYAGLEYHYGYIILCAVLVWFMIPGVGLLYGGLARRRSSLALLFQSLMVIATVTIQWMFWGYSLAYSRTGGPFIGNLDNFGLRHVSAAPSVGSPYVPDLIFCLYQLGFCAVTVQILIGGSFERGRIVPSLVFAFLWATIVYCPIARWTWNPEGWLYQLPSLDFAGGGPVHIASGCSALAYALVLGKRMSVKNGGGRHKPHNTTLVFIGTIWIWFGWFGFNGGSTLNLSVRSAYALFNTNAAASAGIFGWVLVDMVKHKGRFSVVGACEGAIAGLVGITPGAGYVALWISVVIGFITAVVCSLCQDIDKLLRIDEGMDVFKLHGIGGMVGSFLTGIFAQRWVSLTDGALDAPGGLDGNGVQVAKQLAEIAAIAGYSFTVSFILLFILKYIPGMHLRVSEEAEIIGLDLDQFFDEQIGDWSIFDQNPLKTNDNSAIGSASASAAGSASGLPEKTTADSKQMNAVV